MKRIAFAALACFALACAKPAEEETVQTDAAPAPAPETVAVSAEVRATVQKWFDAVAGADHVELDSMHHSSGIFVGGNGSISTHDEQLAHHRTGRIKMSKVGYEILEAQAYGDDFMLVQLDGKSEGESHGRKWGLGAVLIMGLARTPGAPWEVVYFQTVRKEAAPNPT